MSGRWKILISIESSIILNQSYQSFLGQGIECQKKNQEPESWMFIRPLAFANKSLEAEHGEVGWSAVKLHVDIRCRRANGLSVAIFLAIFTAQTVASSELKVGKGENVLGGKEWKAEKWWIHKLYPFTFIWALPHSRSWGRPSQCLCALSNSQLVGVLTNASPLFSGKRGLPLRKAQRLKTEMMEAVKEHCKLSPSFDRYGHCQGTRRSRRRILGHMYTDALKLRQGKKVLTQCSNGLTKNTLSSTYLRCGSSESGSWQHTREGPLTHGLFLLQTYRKWLVPKILPKPSLHLPAIGLRVMYSILPFLTQAMKVSPETRYTWSLRADTYLKQHLSLQDWESEETRQKRKVKQFLQCCPNSSLQASLNTAGTLFILYHRK